MSDPAGDIVHGVIDVPRWERFGAANHGRIGEVVAIRPPGQAYVWLLAGTCHLRSSLAPLLWSSCGPDRLWCLSPDQ